jgi:hypothetical protein
MPPKQAYCSVGKREQKQNLGLRNITFSYEKASLSSNSHDKAIVARDHYADTEWVCIPNMLRRGASSHSISGGTEVAWNPRSWQD